MAKGATLCVVEGRRPKRNAGGCGLRFYSVGASRVPAAAFRSHMAGNAGKRRHNRVFPPPMQAAMMAVARVSVLVEKRALSGEISFRILEDIARDLSSEQSRSRP